MQLHCINTTSNTQPLQENLLPKEVFVQSWHPPVDDATPEQADIRAHLHLLPCYLSKRVCFSPREKKTLAKYQYGLISIKVVKQRTGKKTSTIAIPAPTIPPAKKKASQAFLATLLHKDVRMRFLVILLVDFLCCNLSVSGPC